MISIVTSYYNRKKLFYETLKSITKSKYKDIEFIVVDDGSSEDNRIEDLVNEFPFLHIIRREKEDKWYSNPCIPFNIGIGKTKGDIIVLQNPECLHIHDVLTYINNNITENNYISISAYGVNNDINGMISDHSNDLVDFFNSFPQQPYVGYESIGWYNHPLYRPVYYHFCSAITRSNMEKLNGFDERYAHGIGYDDDELVMRIMKLGLKLKIEDKISVIHQYHDTVSWNKPNAAMLTERNRSLLHNVTASENNYKTNISKKLWSGI